MRRTWPMLLGALLFLPLVARSQTGDLWQKAVRMVAGSRTYVPCSVVSRFELLNGKGEVEHSREMHLKITFDDSGATRTEITKVLEDGQDVTEKAKEEQAKREKEKRAASSSREEPFKLDLGPFDPDEQDRVQYEPLGESKELDGRECVGFHFVHDRGELGKVVGEAWLDRATGAPVKITFQQEPLPKRVKEMRTTVTYAPLEAGCWGPRELTVEGKAGFLFIKKSFRNVVQFGDYRVSPDTAKAEND